MLNRMLRAPPIQSYMNKRTFFVALSHAKEIIIFPFSAERKDRYGKMQPQQLKKIHELFDALHTSEVLDVYKHKV